jgi:hypothetical protein
MNFSRKLVLASGFILLIALPEVVRITGLTPKVMHPALARLPAQMLWAWQRPEDLRGLPADIGVAYVATVITIEGETATVQARQQPLLMAATTARVPVVHIDVSWRNPPALNAVQSEAIIKALRDAVALSNTQVVQLDFEVRRSQRQFLSAVMLAARRQLPANVALSMTALASWCAGDNWLLGLAGTGAGAAADEIVPMAFRMAAGDNEIRALLAKYGQFRPLHCQQAIATATDEPLENLPPASPLVTNNAQSKNFRHYHFSPKPWTLSQWKQWQQWQN